MGLAVAGVLAVGLVPAGTVSAFEGGLTAGKEAAGQGEGLSNAQEPTELVEQVINIILYAAGILAVGFLIFGGIKYVTSSGDSSKVKAAKDTIMYAVIGLAVTILAYVIVNFVITAINSTD